MKTKAETEVMHIQAKECQGQPACQELGEVREDRLLEPSRERGPADTCEAKVLLS